jgi:hypothetical protein
LEFLASSIRCRCRIHLRRWKLIQGPIWRPCIPFQVKRSSLFAIAYLLLLVRKVS